MNKVDIYKCPTRGVRVIISNGIPNHDVVHGNPVIPCEVNWAVEVPLNPTVAATRTEVPIRGMLAMAMNGVPAYGPQEADSLNAVEGMGVMDARFWYGHAGGNGAWHLHNPQMGQEIESHEMLLGYAMDGFPIYGHLDDDSVLDACNGMVNDDGSYQYHVRPLDQIDGDLEYCNGNSPETNWNYILGCYSGSVSNSFSFDSNTYELDDDCVLDDGSTGATPTPLPTPTPTVKPTPRPT